MMANVLLTFLVFMLISAAIGTDDNERAIGIQQRKRGCRNLGGRCIKKNKACPGKFTMETTPGKPYCKRKRRCCYPVPTTKEPTLEEIVCGTETSASTRIVNGVNVKSSLTFPWQVGIRNTVSPKDTFYCGGTIITKTHILTAAHCFYKYGGKPHCKKDVPAFVYVGYGDIKQNLTKSIFVSNVKIYKRYNCQTYENDIAILTLSSPVNSIPICLPRDGNNDEISEGVIIGWGSTKGYDPTTSNPSVNIPNVLQVARVPLINNEQCSNLVHGGVKATQICTSTGNGFNGIPPGNGTCQGDSGGPLVVSKTNSIKQYVQIGITSFGEGCASYKNPDVLTRISKFLKFIHDNTGSEPLYYLD